MAKAAEYGLGPQTFPRGWFIVAEPELTWAATSSFLTSGAGASPR